MSSMPSDRSWLYITLTVIAVHILLISWSIFFGITPSVTQLKMHTHLAVQTIALEPNPIPRNPIPSNRVTPTPIPQTPITPTPLERKTMWPPEPAPQPQPIEQTELPSPYQLEPLRPSTTPAPQQKPVPAEKVAPPKPVDVKIIKKNALEKATEEFKAKQQEISIKKKQELEAIKAQQEEVKKKHQQEAIKKQEHEAAKKKAAEQLAEAQRQQKLVAEAQERIAKISKNNDKLASNKTANPVSNVPQAITSLQIDSIGDIKREVSLSHYELSYREELAGRLKLLLRLPEYGDVKVNLTLDRTGKVSKVAIVNADSTLNRKYIEKTLPELTFPPFGNHYASAAEYTFSITLSNEI